MLKVDTRDRRAPRLVRRGSWLLGQRLAGGGCGDRGDGPPCVIVSSTQMNRRNLLRADKYRQGLLQYNYSTTCCWRLKWCPLTVLPCWGTIVTARGTIVTNRTVLQGLRGTMKLKRHRFNGRTIPHRPHQSR